MDGVAAAWKRTEIVAGLLAAALLAAVALAAWGATFPNDPYFSEQWNMTKIGAPQAWSRGTGAGVLIGVVDTGVDLSHVDLAGKVVASTNCIGANDDPAACQGSAQDDQGHGTHVSGIAAADTNNGVGVAGVAPDARLVIAKALGANGSGALNDVNAAIKWVVDHGAKIVNLSIEADSGALTVLPGQSLAEGVEYAYSRGAIAVVAAGNSTPSLFGGGSTFSNVDAVIVGATGPNDEVAFYSSPVGAAKWGLVAPGGNAMGPDGHPSCAGANAPQCIVSTGWFAGHTNQYADDEGTSMAAPEVSGTLALLMGQGPNLSRDAAVTRLLSSAAKISCGSGCHGRLDAAAAVQASAAPPPPPPPPPTSTPPSPPTSRPRPPASTPVTSVGPVSTGTPAPTPALSPPTSAGSSSSTTSTTGVPGGRSAQQQGAGQAASRVTTSHALGAGSGGGTGAGTLAVEAFAAALLAGVGAALGKVGWAVTRPTHTPA